MTKPSGLTIVSALFAFAVFVGACAPSETTTGTGTGNAGTNGGTGTAGTTGSAGTNGLAGTSGRPGRGAPRERARRARRGPTVRRGPSGRLASMGSSGTNGTCGHHDMGTDRFGRSSGGNDGTAGRPWDERHGGHEWHRRDERHAGNDEAPGPRSDDRYEDTTGTAGRPAPMYRRHEPRAHRLWVRRRPGHQPRHDGVADQESAIRAQGPDARSSARVVQLPGRGRDDTYPRRDLRAQRRPGTSHRRHPRGLRSGTWNRKADAVAREPAPELAGLTAGNASGLRPSTARASLLTPRVRDQERARQLNKVEGGGNRIPRTPSPTMRRHGSQARPVAGEDTIGRPGGSNNLILNAIRPTAAAKLQGDGGRRRRLRRQETGGTGNIFRGCRAW